MLYVLENVLLLLSLVGCVFLLHFFIMKACDILEDRTEEEVLRKTVKRERKAQINKKEGLRGGLFRRRRTDGGNGLNTDRDRNYKRSGVPFGIAK